MKRIVEKINAEKQETEQNDHVLDTLNIDLDKCFLPITKDEQKRIIKEITESNSVPVSVPQAWCPNDQRTTCSLYDKDEHFPSGCVGDIDKQKCLERIQTYVAVDNNHKSQIANYCSRVNDVCVTYQNKQYASAKDRKLCGDLISGCN